MAEQIEVRCGAVAGLRRWLEAHPRVARIENADSPFLGFREDSIWRRVEIGNPANPLFGLVELMDNNPLVCADTASVPSASGTLALIALGPLARCGIIVDAPAVSLSFEEPRPLIDDALATEGWSGGAVLHVEPVDLGSVCVGTASAVVRTPDNPLELGEVFEEAYGRCFFVRDAGPSQWSPDDVLGKPFALYRVSVVPDSPTSLVTVRVMADREGKCGAAQLVHMMNVMAGFEESLGLDV